MRSTRRPPILAALAPSRTGRTYIPAELLGSAADRGVPAVDPAVLESLAVHVGDFVETLASREQSAVVAILKAAAPGSALSALAAAPGAAILGEEDAATFEALRAEPAPAVGGLRPFMVMIMKATRLCNLRCTYCNQWRDGPNQVMNFPVLARAIRDVLRAPGVQRVEFVWHGGEATLLPTAYYRKALWLQQQFRRAGQVVENVMQTNATRVSDEWLDFWTRYEFSVGVSLDGPPEIHDQRRLDKAGRPTAGRVRAGLERLQEAGIPHGVLLVVDEQIVEIGPRRLLDYLREISVTQVDLLNVLPRNTPRGTSLAGMYLSWPGYIDYLREMFRLWWSDYADQLSIRELAGLLQQLTGGPAFSCVFAGDCFGGFLTIDPSGDVSACDKYVDDAEYVFGNLLATNLAALKGSEQLRRIRSTNAAEVDPMRQCRWFAICQGACPHDRYTSARWRPDAGVHCCGLSPLLEDMTETLYAAGVQLSPDLREPSAERVVRPEGPR